MKKIIIFLLLIQPFNANAQRPFVKEEKVHQQTVIRYSLSANNTNGIITSLAEGNGKPQRNAQFTITTDQTMVSSTREPLQQTSIVSEEITVSGDVYYKGFDVSNLLIPSQVQFIIKTWNGNNLLSSVSLNNVDVRNRKPDKKEAIYNDSLGRVTHHSTENFFPVYSSNDIIQFNERVNLIKQYYTDAAALTDNINLLQSINPHDIDHFNLQQQKLSDANHIATAIENKNYNNQLSLQAFDPAKMLNNLSYFHSQAAIVQHDLDMVFSTLYLAYYDRAMDLLTHGNTNGAMNYFQQSLAAHPGFAPALLQLALIDYRNNNYNSAIAKADDILFRFDPDPDTRRLTYQLLGDLYESILDKGVQQINEKEYHKALEFYDNAKNICDKYSNVRCNDELFKGIRTAKNGIYNDYLKDAQNFLDKKQFDKAEQSIADAIKYQRNNNNDINDDSAARKILKEITRERYFTKIEEGKQALANKQYESALNSFDTASQMETDYGFSPNAELPSLKTNAARPLIFIKLDKGDSLVNSNKLTEARNSIRNIADMQAKYSLATEKIFNKRLEELRKKIFSQQCENAQREFDELYLHGKDALLIPDYIKADDFFISAEKVNDENKDCGVNIREIVKEHSAIIPAATYLKKLAQVNVKQKEGDYRNAEITYNEVTKYYSDNNVSRFNISHESFYDYLLYKANNGFLFYAGEQYTSRDELDKALNIFRLLISRNYDYRQLKGSLYQLGIKIGKKDKLEHPGEKYSNDYVREYSNRDRKMKSFEKGYKKGWKMK